MDKVKAVPGETVHYTVTVKNLSTADPGQFPYKPAITDQTTSFTYEVALKKAGPIYIAAHSETYVPFWEMNAFYNTTKY